LFSCHCWFNEAESDGILPRGRLTSSATLRTPSSTAQNIMADKIVVAFDLYGTLLSTASIAKQLEGHYDHAKAQTISALWRRYQLEYTWRLNSMGKQPQRDILKVKLTVDRPL
jgi:hypothetical protein